MTAPPRNLAIIGAGGHGAVIVDAARTAQPHRPIVLFDLAPQTREVIGCPVITGEPDPASFPPDQWEVHVAIGANPVRIANLESLGRMGYAFATIVHPSAVLAESCSIGAGTAIMAGAVINARATIGMGCIINTGAIVEHDAAIGLGTHISPGAVAAGGARIGERCWIGANAVVRQNVAIANDVVLGALSFAVSDIDEHGTYVGTPARKLY